MKEAALRSRFRICVRDGSEARGAGEKGCCAGCWGRGEECSSLIIRGSSRVGGGVAVLRSWREDGFGSVATSTRGLGGGGGGVEEGFKFVEIVWGGGGGLGS